jgi:hypothetical protein
MTTYDRERVVAVHHLCQFVPLSPLETLVRSPRLGRPPQCRTDRNDGSNQDMLQDEIKYAEEYLRV